MKMRQTIPRRRQQVYRFYIPLLSRVFPFLSISIPRFTSIHNTFYLCASSAMYMIGPFLIIVTLGIVYAIVYTICAIVIPLEIGPYDSSRVGIHLLFLSFDIFNVLYNYYYCVITRNFPGMHYDKVVRELASATGFEYPKDDTEMEEYRSQYKSRMMERVRQRRMYEEAHSMRRYGLDGVKECDHKSLSQSNTILDQTNVVSVSKKQVPSITAELTEEKSVIDSSKIEQPTKNPTIGTVSAWYHLGSHEWSYDERVKLPKPPRSHFDSVTKTLVLCMDHYCPWMFGVIGYFNYRYFCNFLLYALVGLIYGAVMTSNLYLKIDSEDYVSQIRKSRELYKELHSIEWNGSQTAHFRNFDVKHLIPGTPIPSEVPAIYFSFMICVAIGISISILLGFHIHLILSAQTTIEFHGNKLRKSIYKELGQEFHNPYNLGVRRNVEQVYGTWKGGWFGFFLTLLPSSREPEFLPIPLKGDIGKRSRWCIKDDHQGTDSDGDDMV